MDLYNLLDAVQTIARNGLNYCENDYDRERYQRLLDLAVNEYSALLDQPTAEIKAAFQKEFGHITPKVGADAAIFNEKGEILLMDRVDGSGWCLPCGWVDPNEKPSQAAIREVKEETGLDVAVKQFVGVFTRFPHSNVGVHALVALVHLCEVTGGELRLSHEGVALHYWPLDAVPRWHANHQRFAEAAYLCWQNGQGYQAISD